MNASGASRRRFLNRSAALAGALCTSGLPAGGQLGLLERHARRKPVPAAEPLVYFGCDSGKPGSKGIYVSRFNGQTGQLSPPGLAAETVRPSFLALNRASPRKILYAVNEGGEHDSGVSTFEMDPASGRLRKLGEVSSGGAGPCYIGVDASGSSAYVADYTGGIVASYRVQPDGTLQGPVSRIDFHNPPFPKPGPRKDRQDAPHPHFAAVSPTNSFLVVNDLGLDAIVTFPIDASTGRVGKPAISQAKPGSGPRHLVFHPNGRWVYVVDELSCRVDQYLWTQVHGTPGVAPQALLTSTGNSISTLAPGTRGTATAGEILIGPDGFTLYVSNRLAENSLVLLRIDPNTGALRFDQRIDSGGKTPRQFTLDPTGGWLVCGNQDSDSVCVFRRNQGDGRLSGPVQTLPLVAPMMTLFA